MLRIGERVVDVDEAVLALAASHCRLEPYRAEPLAAPWLRLERVGALPPEERTPLGDDAGTSFYAVRGDVIRVCLPDVPAAAEAALRALFQLAFVRQGGLLLHGAGVSFEGRGLVATGPSGAGKSTLARLCRQAGAALLSDESVALFPDGRLYGTPFRSDPDLPGEAIEAKLQALVVLEKGAVERLSPVEPSRAAALLLGQVYRLGPRELGRAELLRRIGSLAARPGVHRLTFRKDPAAGRFVAGWLRGEHAPA